MKLKQRRTTAMQALVQGSVIAGYPISHDIHTEFDEVLRAEKVPQQSRRWLLQVLHSTRALDSSLEKFCVHHNCSTGNKSLGQYLCALRDHNNPTINRLPALRRTFFQIAIVDKRNLYMHKAGQFPGSDSEIIVLISDMETCLAETLSL